MNIRRILVAAAAVVAGAISVVPSSGAPVNAAPGDPIVPVAGQRTLSGDYDTTCVILAAGSVQCWGEGSSGEIGDGGGGDRPRPSTVTGLTNVVDISAGDDITCAVTSDGRLWCWGTDSNGELGNGPGATGDTFTPQPVPGMNGTVDVAAGYDHVCAVKADGTAWCWGEGDGGELASGTIDDQVSPFQIPGITDALAAAVAQEGSCVLHRDGTVSCWGNNSEGEAGNGTTDPVDVPTKVAGVTGAIDIEKADDATTCALIDDGTVRCWGDASADWLDGTSTPVTFPFLDDAIGLRTGDETICVIRSDFSLWCAGDDSDRLPNDHPEDRETLDPTGITGVADATIGESHGCVLLATGTVECWGRNGTNGALGVGAPSETDPVEVPGIGTPTAIDAGGDTTCAIVNGQLWCWGRNDDRLIVDSDANFVADPTRVGTATNLVDVSLGYRHACVLDANDKVACWGRNFDGELGVGDTTDRPATPTQVAGNFREVSAGFQHTCAIRLNDAVACWGRNSFGELATGGTGPDVLVPTTIVVPDADFTTISTGWYHTCAVTVNARVRCWGRGNAGQLGQGSTSDETSPTLVDDPNTDFVGVAAADGASCATRGTIVTCWGGSNMAEGAGTIATTPVDKTLVGPWTSLDAYDEHACAIRESDDVVHCWGSSWSLRLTSAAGTNSRIAEPLAAAGVGPAIAVTTGSEHSCAIETSGRVMCWGANGYGQAGLASEFETPQTVTLSGPALVDVVPTPPPTAPPTTAPPTGPAQPSGSDVFVSVSPARLVETRMGPGLTTIDGVQEGIGRLTAGEELTVAVAGRANVPADAAAAVLNVTAIGPDSAGFVTAHACLDPRPLASSLNFAAGTNLGNEIIVELDDSGDVCLFTSAGMHLAVDVAAYLPAGAEYRPVGPARLADTRTNGAADTVDGQFEADGIRQADTEYTIRVAGRAGVSTDAKAAVINVTAIGATGRGFFTVHPCTATRPTSASLNYIAGVNRGNEIIAPLSANGDVCVYTSTTTQLSIDVVGEVTADRYVPIVPARYLDTRPGQAAIDGAVEDDGVRTAGQTTVLSIAGVGSVPNDATTVTLNVTAVGPESVGFVTVHPCLPSAPNTASLNYTAGVNGGNEIIAELDANGDVCLFTSSPTHLTVDVAGYTR
ncbi:MAG: RCC1 domain-containing protein [Ilumatobacter sp.]|uniref:RCC1 domain-containing protein n=1 Tax=Ilumatobacter sp. TaxID=1967498 RepID=UPI003918DCFC